MKNILLPLLLFLMASCAATRQSAQSTSTNESLTEKTEEQSTKTEKVVDTTKTENGKITITEIEFYPPIESEEPQDKANATTTEPKPKKSKQSNVAGVNLSNVGNITDAAIKSIKQTTIESENEQKGESKESNESDNSKNQATLSNTTQSGTEESTPAPDPYRWRIYLLYFACSFNLVVVPETCTDIELDKNNSFRNTKDFLKSPIFSEPLLRSPVHPGTVGEARLA